MDLTPYRYSRHALRYLRQATPEEHALVDATLALVNTRDPRLLVMESPDYPGVMVTLMANGHVVAWRVHDEFPMLYEVLHLGPGRF